MYLIDWCDNIFTSYLNVCLYIAMIYCHGIAQNMSEMPSPPHEFAHPPRGYNWLQNIKFYAIILPFNGMTFWQKIVNISELVPAMTWLDARPLQCVLRVCVARTSLPWWKMRYYTQKCYNVGRKLQRDSRSHNRSFLFQSCCGVGCHGAMNYVSTVKRRVNIVEGTCISSVEEKVFLRTSSECVCRITV
jgi:hypothetical protein